MLRKIVILNYNSFLGKVVIFINEKKKRGKRYECGI